MTSGRRVLLLIVVAALCAAAAFAIAVLVMGEFGPTQGRILTTSGAVAAFGLLSLPAAVLLDQGRSRPLAGALIAAAALGFALFVVMIWSGDDPPATLVRTVASVCVVAVALAQSAAVWARRRDDDPRVVRGLLAASWALAGALALVVIVAVWLQIDSAVYYRLLGVLVVLDLLLVALQPTLARLHAARAGAHRLALVLESGERREVVGRGRDFAAAVAGAVREAEAGGGRVVGVERLGPGG
jgi:hypothetical protein